MTKQRKQPSKSTTLTAEQLAHIRGGDGSGVPTGQRMHKPYPLETDQGPEWPL